MEKGDSPSGLAANALSARRSNYFLFLISFSFGVSLSARRSRALVKTSSRLSAILNYSTFEIMLFKHQYLQLSFLFYHFCISDSVTFEGRWSSVPREIALNRQVSPFPILFAFASAVQITAFELSYILYSTLMYDKSFPVVFSTVPVTVTV